MVEKENRHDCDRLRVGVWNYSVGLDVIVEETAHIFSYVQVSEEQLDGQREEGCVGLYLTRGGYVHIGGWWTNGSDGKEKSGVGWIL